jgi:t-SNARE complex subunit (syntaxin)
MDSSTSISVGVIISLVSLLAGVIGAYVRLKSDINVQSTKIDRMEQDIDDVQERKKEAVSTLHKRIDNLKQGYIDLQKEVHQGHQSLETKIAQMELRIVREIQKLAK